jgi:hypothetical protein
MKHKDVPPRLLIVGMPRSGTTLVAENIAGAGLASIGPETDFYARYYWRIRSALHAGTRERVDLSREFRRDLDEFGYRAGEGLNCWSSPSDFLFRHLEQSLPKDVVVGEKTPKHAEWVLRALAEDERVRVVFLVRDPRDVLRSLDRVPWTTSSSARRVARWVHYARLADRVHHRYRQRALVVRFEDWVNATERWLRQVGLLLGTERMADGGVLLEASGRTFRSSSEPWKSKALQPTDSRRAFAWRAEPGPDTMAIGALAGPWLRRWDYATGTEPRFHTAWRAWSQLMLEGISLRSRASRFRALKQGG